MFFKRDKIINYWIKFLAIFIFNINSTMSKNIKTNTRWMIAIKKSNNQITNYTLDFVIYMIYYIFV